MLPWLIEVRDDIERVEIDWGLFVPFEDARRRDPLQRREAERVSMIMAERELHEAVAESADAVVEQNGIGA